jgi:hypothetical protein
MPNSCQRKRRVRTCCTFAPGEAPTPGQGFFGHPPVRRAVAFLEDNAHLAIGLSEITAAAATIRMPCSTFRHHNGCDPNA